MSWSDDGHRPFFHVNNPFRMIFRKGSNVTSKLHSLIQSFEETLAERFRKLKPKDGSDIFSLLWMRDAVLSLCETHMDIKSLITELEFPVSDWDHRWMDVYLDNSVKLLDICTAFSSKLSHIDQGQLSLHYVLHVLDSSRQSFSDEDLKQARASLYDWMWHLNCSSPRFDNSSSVLQELVVSHDSTKVKNSSKGKVLSRAMYGVKAHTVYICSLLWSFLSGSRSIQAELPIPEKFLWAEAFKDLQSAVDGQIKRSFPHGRIVLKELEAIDQCVEKLVLLTRNVDRDKGIQEQDGTDMDLEHLQGTNGIAKDKTEGHVHDSSEILAERPEYLHINGVRDMECEDMNVTNALKLKATNGTSTMTTAETLQNCVSSLGKSSKQLVDGIELLSKQVNDFFLIVLSGRDALLCNLRIPSAVQEDTVEESR